MDHTELSFWIGVGDIACWGACFLWMHRISKKQNRLLDELREQAGRIESLSKSEHDLIREVHPQVGDIKAGVEEALDMLRPDDDKQH